MRGTFYRDGDYAKSYSFSSLLYDSRWFEVIVNLNKTRTPGDRLNNPQPLQERVQELLKNSA